MSDKNIDLPSWLRESQATIERLQADESKPIPEPVSNDIVAAIQRIDARYQINFELPADEQLPMAVFERLVEQLQPIVASVMSISLYEVLRELPEETFGKKVFIDDARVKLIEEASRRLEEHSEDVDALLVRGQLHFDDDDMEAAKLDFAKVVQLDPTQARARRSEVLANLKERNDAEALSLLNEMLKLAPEDEFALLERARLWVRYSYIPEALEALEQLAATTKSNEVLLFAAKQFLFSGRPADSLAAARRVNPSAETLLVRGKALLDLGDVGTAVSTLEQALELTIGQESLQQFASAKVSALKLLGDAHVRLGNRAQALARYIEAMGCVGTTYELRRAVVKLAWEDREAGAQAKGRGSPTARGESEAAWIEPNMSASFVDGKPIEVTSADLQLAPYLERLPWTTVVERVEIGAGRRDNREAFVQLFQLELPQLRQLDLQAEHFGFPCVFRLVAAPFFPRLESLVIRECDLDFPSMLMLLERAPVALRELRLFSANARPRLPRAITLAEALRRWERPSLKTLELTDCALSADEVMAITEARLPKLETLVLTGNDLTKLDVTRFLDSALVHQLHELRIGESSAELELLLGIFDRIDQLSLKRVWAQRPWTEDELRTVKSHPAFQKLELVELGVSQVSEEAWLALLE